MATERVSGGETLLEPVHWQEFLPFGDKARTDALAVLHVARRDPKLARQCLDYGWDGQRKFSQARDVVTKVLPALRIMHQQALRDRDDDDDDDDGGHGHDDGASPPPPQPDHGPPGRMIEYRESIQRLRKARRESSKLRTIEGKARRETTRLRKDRDKVQRALDECQRIVTGFESELAKHQAVVDKCDRDASALESDQAVIKYALTSQTVDLMRDYAGIDLTADGQLSQEASSGEAEGAVDLAGCQHGRPGAQRPVTRAAMRAEVHTYGSFADSPPVTEHMLQRLSDSRSGPGAAAATQPRAVSTGPAAPSALPGLPPVPVSEPVRLDPNADQQLDRARDERRRRRRSNRLRVSGKEPRKEHEPGDALVEMWEELREVVRHYREDADIPEIFLEPDGVGPHDLDSSWWERFSSFWGYNASRPFLHRDHHDAERFLAEWKELTKDLPEQPLGGGAAEEEEEEGVLHADHVSRASTPSVPWTQRVPEAPSSSDSELERMRTRVGDETREVCGQLRAFLDRGVLHSGDDAALAVRDFLDSTPEQQDLEGLHAALRKAKRALAAPPVDVPPPPPPRETEQSKGGQVDAPATAPTEACEARPQPSAPNHEKRPSGWLSSWNDVLEDSVRRNRISEAESQALSRMATQYASLVMTEMSRRTPDEGGGGEPSTRSGRTTRRARRRRPSLAEVQRQTRLKRYRWASSRLGYVKNFLVEKFNVAYLRGHPQRCASRGLNVAPLDDRLARHRHLKDLMTRMRKMLSTDRLKPIAAPNKTVELSSNYVHRDLWIADFRLCTLRQALSNQGAGAELHNVAKPWNYTMGGWACIRCARPLKTKNGNCSCRCFRGHTRTECGEPGSGCYGFHPNRYMEFIALGLPRDPVEYMETLEEQLYGETLDPIAEDQADPEDLVPVYTEDQVETLVESSWETYCFNKSPDTYDEGEGEEEEGEDAEPWRPTPDEEAEIKEAERRRFGRITRLDMINEERRLKRFCIATNSTNSWSDRQWSSRQRWRCWRQLIKDIVQGYDPWFGVVPPQERGLDFDGIVDDVAPLIRDWFERMNPPKEPTAATRRGPRTPAGRCRWLAKYHLDLLLDKSKYEAERRQKHPPNRGVPSWRWICDHCPLCGMSMESNKNNTCRGLCDGCRAWQKIVGPEDRLIGSGEPYNVFKRGYSRYAPRGRHRNRKRTRSQARRATAPSPSPSATTARTLRSRTVTKPKRRQRARKRPRFAREPHLAPSTETSPAESPPPPLARKRRRAPSRGAGIAFLRAWKSGLSLPVPPIVPVSATPIQRRRGSKRRRGAASKAASAVTLALMGRTSLPSPPPPAPAPTPPAKRSRHQRSRHLVGGFLMGAMLGAAAADGSSAADAFPSL